MQLAPGITAILFTSLLLAQPQSTTEEKTGFKQVTEAPQNGFVVGSGTSIPLELINSVSTKNAAEGDRVYLQTAFPILAGGRIVIPPGSYVAGTVTQVKRPGRMKGRGELYLRFDTLTLPNGVTREFRARVGAIDGRGKEELDRTEGKIKSEGNKAGDLMTIGSVAGAGASVGGIGGAVSGAPLTGTLIGAGIGAAAGLIGVLASRGPDAILARGSTVEMVIDRPLSFTQEDLEFGQSPQKRTVDGSDGPVQQKNRNTSNLPGRRLGGVL